MHVNRLKRYFDAAEEKQESPLSSAVAFEIFVQSPDRDFTHRLSRVMAALRKDVAHRSAAKCELMNMVLCPCFIQTGAENSLFQIEFIGDESRARRALCAAALMFVTGWEQITPEARKWSRELLICAIPPNISLPALRDLANGKALIGSMMSGMSYKRPSGTFNSLPDSSSSSGTLTDPFIGL
ncbi:MAG TPA: hypothetical protein VEH27_07895 [Methylomirabilota bacterium]|nr:hypothetical protein [Methylomirabilota bacterium]